MKERKPINPPVSRKLYLLGMVTMVVLYLLIVAATWLASYLQKSFASPPKPDEAELVYLIYVLTVAAFMLFWPACFLYIFSKNPFYDLFQKKDELLKKTLFQVLQAVWYMLLAIGVFSSFLGHMMRTGEISAPPYFWIVPISSLFGIYLFRFINHCLRVLQRG